MKNETARRKFLKQLTTIGIAGAVTPAVVNAALPGEPHSELANTPVGYTFLFQGDSITDGNRTRNNDWNHVMGHGYQYIIASKLWYDFPQKRFHFFNRGISGNKITDLAARWQTDTLDIKPDLLSILIGINDVSTYIQGDNNFSATGYENGCRALLQQTRQQLPSLQLVLCEPFVLPVGRIKEQWEQYSKAVTERRAIVKKLSVEFNAIFVEFQAAFNKALSKAPAEYWIWDGIHPMPAGHELMAREWLRQVNRKANLIK